MKALIVLAVALMTSASFAGVGDEANYNATSGGYEFKFTQKLIAYNAQTKLYTRENITTLGTEVSSSTEELTAEDALTEDTIAMILNLCETPMISGKLETVTVPAGTFETCLAKDEDNGLANIGMVPFGIVKYQSSQVNLELISFKIAE